ncbi:MAG: TonB-dependent receptor plug domain-containing protein [Chitinophagales bacterium]|nr:TonB-dependent receptor plug domain-containing protein [Chitinophagales bacterium]
MKRIFALAYSFLLLHSFGYAQYSICGKVTVNQQIKGQSWVSILGIDDSVATDKIGQYCFRNLPLGEYILAANTDGFMSEVQFISLKKDTNNVNFNIEILSTDTVSVVAERIAERRSNISIKTEIVDLSKQSLSSVSVEQLMNRASGIRVRNSGGLGSDADIVVGGFSGKSVKFLIDGIPIDYLGSSMGITKMPINMADYVEVYKGVLPTEIGVDALGAAVNIVTRRPDKTGYRLSYELGSFHTHKVGVNSFVRHSPKLSYGVDAFFNYSKNDFKVDHLPVSDEQTGKTKYIRAPLFHNGYRQFSADMYLNIEKRKWTDLLEIKLNAFTIKKDIQNDFASRDKAYGEVFRKEKAYIVPSVLYKKSFVDGKLKLSQFFVFSRINFQFADTLKNAYYDWLGQKYEASSSSETGNDFSNLKQSIIYTDVNNIIYRGLFSYQLNDDHKLILNIVENYVSRESDDMNKYHTRSTIDYNRLIVGAGYSYHFLDSRLQGLTQLKYLLSHTDGELINQATLKKEEPVQNSGWSFSQSLKYDSYSGWLIRASTENSYRLPDQMEIFGDNVHVLPNISLQPEKSFNVNLGVRYKKKGVGSIEVNSYYRNIRDMIKLKEITQLQAAYINLEHVRGYGVELEAAVFPVKNFEISGNLTYNEFRFKGSNSNISQNEHFVNARVSNMPFYFGNANVSYLFDKVFDQRSKLKLYWTYSYVHQFYLDYIEKQFEPDGFLGIFGNSKIYTNRIIPVQQVHSAGLIWSFDITNIQKVAVATELNNIFNQDVYNNFKMQSAGRNYSLKLTVEF